MNLCNDDHDEVCFEGRTCPACAIREDLQKDIDQLQSDVSKLERENGDLEDQVSDLQSELKEARRE